jgi:5-methylcytosine-specific restriction protein A
LGFEGAIGAIHDKAAWCSERREKARMKRARIQILKPRVATLDTRTAKPLPKEVDPHYNTPEHAAWAKEVKRRAGWRCEHEESGIRCERSASHGDRIYADHIKDIKDHPELALDLRNGRAACNSHNTRAGIRAREHRMSQKL